MIIAILIELAIVIPVVIIWARAIDKHKQDPGVAGTQRRPGLLGLAVRPTGRETPELKKFKEGSSSHMKGKITKEDETQIAD